jgi:hypothetical protein
MTSNWPPLPPGVDTPTGGCARPAMLSNGSIDGILRSCSLSSPPGPGPPTATTCTRMILGNQRDAVLAKSLGSLSQERLRQLLRHPRHLLDLQELIVSSGRPFWHRRAESALEQAPASDQRAAIDRDWAWLTTNVIDQPAASLSVPFRPDAIHSSAAATQVKTVRDSDGGYDR